MTGADGESLADLFAPRLADFLAQADRPPLAPRLPLCWEGLRIGSVQAEVPVALALPHCLQAEGDGWAVKGALTPALAEIALALKAAGYVHAWRDEQLPVWDASGQVLGTVERGAVRALGIATRAVHLLGFAPDGRHWVQQRAWTKPNDPGLWDTLVGGMVPAGESLEAALERETWEEAGLRLAQLRGVSHGGHVLTRRPSSEHPAGYVVERLDWFRCEVPEGVVPANQDGEVAQFARLEPHEVWERMAGGGFTLDAALLISAAR